MKLNLKARDWHNWTSVILLVPMLLVGMTAIFLAHKKSLALDDVDISAYVAWLPGYGNMKSERPEMRTSIADTNGRRWIAGKEGLYRIVAGRAEAVPELAGLQVRDLAATDWGLVAATKGGVWAERDGNWKLVHKGDAWSANRNPDGSIVVALKDKGLVLSRDGQRWDREASPEVAAVDDIVATLQAGGERITLGKLVMDLHTGKAFFGKEAEWIWIDLLGFVWVFLGFTGLYLWWRAQTKRRDAARKQWEAAHG